MRAYGPYRAPPEEDNYVIGVDVAEGLAYGDYSCAQVLDGLGRQVACWHGHIDPYAYADMLVNLEAVPKRLHDYRKKQPWTDYAAPNAGIAVPKHVHRELSRRRVRRQAHKTRWFSYYIKNKTTNHRQPCGMRQGNRE